jgi:hypothetical protein
MPHVSPERTRGDDLIVILSVHLEGHAELMDIAHTGGLPALLPRPGEHREENGRQDRDDGDDHQQFNERKAASALVHGCASFAAVADP